MNTYIPAKVFINKLFNDTEQYSWKISMPFTDRMESFFLRIFLLLSKRLEPIIYIKAGSDIDPKLLTVALRLKRAGVCEEVSYIQDEGSGYYRAAAKKTVPYGVELRVLHSNGVDKDKNVAFSKALGEIVERVVGGLLDQNRRVYRKSLNDITSEYYDPTRVHRYAKKYLDTFSWLSVDRNKEIDWVRGVSLITTDKVFIPRSLTSWHRKSPRGSEYLVSATTNGSAGYFTREGAVLRGLLEVIERDAFLVHWLTKVAPPNIIIDSLPDVLFQRLSEIRQDGDMWILDTMTEVGVPSVAVVFIQTIDGIDLICVSAAASTTYSEAVERALKEIIPCVRYSKSFLPAKVVTEKEPMSYLDKDGRVKWWIGKGKRDSISWFLEGTTEDFSACEKKNCTSVDAPDSRRLAVVKERLSLLGEGYEPLVYFPKHEVLRQVGFYVAQVFVLKLFPMYLVEYLGAFDSDRLKDFVEYKKVNFVEPNDTPHPFS